MITHTAVSPSKIDNICYESRKIEEEGIPNKLQQFQLAIACPHNEVEAVPEKSPLRPEFFGINMHMYFDMHPSSSHTLSIPNEVYIFLQDVTAQKWIVLLRLHRCCTFSFAELKLHEIKIGVTVVTKQVRKTVLWMMQGELDIPQRLQRSCRSPLQIPR